jgi:hypothetical protein
MALHYVFLPRIQNHLDRFCEAYIRKPIRTANNRSPLQLWISGQMLDPRPYSDEVLHYDVHISENDYSGIFPNYCKGSNTLFKYEEVITVLLLQKCSLETQK